MDEHAHQGMQPVSAQTPAAPPASSRQHSP